MTSDAEGEYLDKNDDGSACTEAGGNVVTDGDGMRKCVPGG